MKNIQVIDGAINCVYDIFAATDEEFRNVNGIHGTLFYENEPKKVYYPTRRDEEAVNPGGTRLRT